MRDLIDIVALMEAAPTPVDPSMIGHDLYHGTSVFGLIEMLDANMVKGRRDKTGITGVSCTTNLKWAQTYARVKTWGAFEKFASEEKREERWADNRFHEAPVLVLDAQAIIRDFEVVAVRWMQKSPVEERVKGDISPLKSYLKKVIIAPETLTIYEAALVEKSGPLWRKRLESLRALVSSGLISANP